MSKIYLSHFSAFILLRYARSNYAKIKTCNNFYHPMKNFDIQDLKTIHNIICNLCCYKIKLDVILDPSSKRRNKTFVNFHYQKAQLNKENYVKIEVKDKNLQFALFDKIVIPSAELCLFQLSKYFPLNRLILFGMELCGSYSIDYTTENGFKGNVLPVTNIDKLKSTFKNIKTGYLGNSKKVSTCLRWITDNSYSPAESILYLILCGPRNLGYFQVKKLNLNMEITLSKKAKLLCGLSAFRPDMCNQEYKLAIEYDSKRFHENVEQNQKDKMRFSALYHDGWHVISVVPKTLSNYESLSTIAKDIMKYLNQDQRIKSKNFKEKSIQAFNDIKNLQHQSFMISKRTKIVN